MTEPVFEIENESQDDYGVSRRALLTAGAIAGAVLVLPKLPAHADFLYGYSDVQMLRYLQEVACLEADFFSKAASSGTADGLQEREMNALNLIAKQDGELSRWFKVARQRYNVGSDFYTPNMSASRPLPVYQFGLKNFETKSALYSMAISIKTTAVGAFHGVVGDASSPQMIQAFAALAGVQGRHLAILRELSGQNPFVAYEPALGRHQVAENLSDYGFNREVIA